MSASAIARTVLAAASSVTDVVPEARIFIGTVPQESALPAIGIRQISGTERTTVTMAEPGRFRTNRVQVTAYAASYEAKDELLELVRAALSPYRGTVASTWAVDSITPDGEGPDFDDEAARIFERSRDFLVSWIG